MAYFAVTHKNRIYINRELLKDARNLTDKMIEMLVAKKEIRMRLILDELMYEHHEIPGLKDVKVQDMDVVCSFENAGSAEEHAYASGETFFLPDSTIPFVKFTTIHCSAKYKRIDAIPTVKVCGTIYAALFRKKKGHQSPLVIVDTRS